jgi:hypothetical protein
MTRTSCSLDRHRRLGCVVAMAVIAASLLGAAPLASAATQIGQTFSPNTLGSNDTLLQSGSPGGQYAVPFSGVITSWSFQAGADPPELNFKAARHASGDNFTIVGQSGLQTGIIANALNTFPTRIPVQAGDVIGFFVGDAGQVRRTGITGYTVADDDDDLDQPVGRTDQYPPVAGDQLDLSAMLEPDCDGDQFGDETQDPELTGPNCPPPAPAPKADRTLTLDANKNKVKKGKKVRFSGQLDAPQNEAGCEPNQTVELQRKAKKAPDSAFATFKTLQSNNTGNFATKVKVKETRVYRAVVQETAACDDEVSNTKKVRLKKRK